MIKAINTKYKGYNFRSRLEARWAVFLDSVKEEWQYELEGYKLPSGCYLPDFWLPRLDCYLEIKGVEPTERELKLLEELAEETGRGSVIVWGLPDEMNMKVYVMSCDDNGGYLGWHDLCYFAIGKDGRLCITTKYRKSHEDFYTGSNIFYTDEGEVCHYYFLAIGRIEDTLYPVPKRYTDTARSARFEFN